MLGSSGAQESNLEALIQKLEEEKKNSVGFSNLKLPVRANA